jgi:hypothetical protein
MTKGHCTHSRLRGFAVGLIQLHPQMSSGRAVNCAVENVHHAADVEPCSAAGIFVQMNPIAEPVTERRARQQRTAVGIDLLLRFLVAAHLGQA